MTIPSHNVEPRWFWWSADQLTSRWWPPIIWGGDEWCRRTLGLRMPGGVFFLCLWRFSDAKGPCARCGLWEPACAWPEDIGENCMSCHHELIDRERGCVCPSLIDEDLDPDDWPNPLCPLHAAA